MPLRWTSFYTCIVKERMNKFAINKRTTNTYPHWRLFSEIVYKFSAALKLRLHKIILQCYVVVFWKRESLTGDYAVYGDVIPWSESCLLNFGVSINRMQSCQWLGVRQWFSPGPTVSSTPYNRLVKTYPQYCRKSDEKLKFKIRILSCVYHQVLGESKQLKLHCKPSFYYMVTTVYLEFCSSSLFCHKKATLQLAYWLVMFEDSGV